MLPRFSAESVIRGFARTHLSVKQLTMRSLKGKPHSSRRTTNNKHFFWRKSAMFWAPVLPVGDILLASTSLSYYYLTACKKTAAASNSSQLYYWIVASYVIFLSVGCTWFVIIACFVFALHSWCLFLSHYCFIFPNQFDTRIHFSVRLALTFIISIRFSSFASSTAAYGGMYTG